MYIALVNMGVDPEWRDEIGKSVTHSPASLITDLIRSTARETMLDSAMIHFATGRVDQPDFLSVVQSVTGVERDYPDGRGLSERLQWYTKTRSFSHVHQALLNLERYHEPLQSRLHAALRECDVDEVDRSGRSSLAWAVEYRHVEGVQALLNIGASAGFVRRSICGNKMPLLHLLLAGPTNGISALLSIVEALIRGGADIMATDNEGWTPLHIAASWNMYSISRMLLDSVDRDELLTARTKEGETAYDLACDSECDEDLCLLLNLSDVLSEVHM